MGISARGCKADFFLDCLQHVESDYRYLVGDIDYVPRKADDDGLRELR